jgi:hypothetical protein
VEFSICGLLSVLKNVRLEHFKLQIFDLEMLCVCFFVHACSTNCFLNVASYFFPINKFTYIALCLHKKVSLIYGHLLHVINLIRYYCTSLYKIIYQVMRPLTYFTLPGLVVRLNIFIYVWESFRFLLQWFHIFTNFYFGVFIFVQLVCPVYIKTKIY